MGTRSNIKVRPSNAIWNGSDLGFLDGDIEIKVEDQAVDITAHQEGTNVIDAIRTGKSAEVTLTLKETSVAQLTTLLNISGDTASAVAEITDVTISTIVAINSKYFRLFSGDNAQGHKVWFNVNLTGTAPSTAADAYFAGTYNLVEVTLDATPTVAEAVTALQVAVDAEADFIATESGTTVTITNAANGPATDAFDANGYAGFTFLVTTQGIGALPGWGNSKDFTAHSTQAAQLTLHPIAFASTVKTDDLNFWKAYPMLDTITLSGENPEMIAVTFKCYPDYTRPQAVRLFALGDGS